MPARTGLAEAAGRCPRQRIFQRIKRVLSLAQSRTQRHDVRGQAWSFIRVVVETKLMFDVTPRTWHMSRHSVDFVALVLYFFLSSDSAACVYSTQTKDSTFHDLKNVKHTSPLIRIHPRRRANGRIHPRDRRLYPPYNIDASERPRSGCVSISCSAPLKSVANC